MGDKKSLEQRVTDFALLRLPGQPQAMHMGTASLVDELWREVERLREIVEPERTAPEPGAEER